MAVATTTALLAASMAATAVGGISSAKAQKKQAQASLDEGMYNSAMSELQAKDVKRAAQDQADKIRVEAESVRATQQTQQAASGVVIGEGSAGTMVDQTTKLSEADALVALYNGSDGYVKNMSESRYMKEAGINRANSLNQSSNATLLSTAGSLAGQYGSYMQLKTKK